MELRNNICLNFEFIKNPKNDYEIFQYSNPFAGTFCLSVIQYSF